MVVHLGYAVICDNCEKQHQFPKAETREAARHMAIERGLFHANVHSFCNEDCYEEYKLNNFA